MATYTAPTTRTTGALISASIWNTDIVENLKYFKDAPVFDGDVSVGDDLLLPSTGAVINFASGDVTITHSTNTLTFAGASSGYAFQTGLVSSAEGIAIAATKRFYLDGVAGTGNTYISEESGDVIALTAGGTVGLRVNTDGVNTVTGSQSVNSGVATTLFSVTTKGLYEVFAYYGGASAIYLSAARVMSDGAGFYRATFDNGAGLTLSLSGSNVQATQSSGGALTIQYRFVRISD